MKTLKRANRSGKPGGKGVTKSVDSILPRASGNQIRKKAKKRKLRSDSNADKERYEFLFERSQTAVIVFGPDLRVVASNPMAQRLFGMTPEEMKGKETTNFPWVFLREDGGAMPASEFPVYRALTSHEPVSNMVVGIKRIDQRDILWTIASAYCVRDTQRKPAEIVVSYMDVTDRKQADHVQRRLNRELHAITNCNEVLLRATDEYALLHDICRIVCEEAGYRMAWVGYAEHDEGKAVRPVAWAGYEEGYLTDARISWADVKRGRGPSGTAIRDGKSHGIQDFATDPRAEPWRVEALRRGYQSSIASPLKDEHSSTFGVLTIYSQETNAFTPDEIRLIEELAGDLAFGITTLRTRVERTLAQREITLLSFAMNSVHEAAYLIDEHGRFSLVNDESCRMLGYSREELLHMSVPDIDPDYPADRWSTHWDQLKKGGSFRWEGHHRTKGGTLVPVEINANYFEYTGKAYNFALVRDITERKRAEQERIAHLRFFECMDQVNRAIQSAGDLDQMMSRVLDAALSALGCDRAFLVYPCDPDASTWRASMERTRPEYPGALALGIEFPMTPEVAESLRPLLAADGPVKFGPGTSHPLPADIAQQFGIKCYMSMALRPKVGLPWEFGIHQCSHVREWTVEEERLFKEIGRRLEDGLGALVSHRDLRDSREKLVEAQRMASVGYWDRDILANRITLAAEACRIFGIGEHEEVLNLGQWHERWLTLIHPGDRQRVAKAAQDALEGDRPYNVDYRIIRPAGEMRYVHSEAYVTKDASRRPIRMLGMMQDITERKRNDAINMSRLHLIQYAQSHSLDDILEETLNEAERLTGSLIGFYHFVEEDQLTLSLQNWSTRTKAEFCKAEGKGMHYPIDSAGVWVECVHERKPLIHNDYALLPNRKGMPPGHAEVKRELVVPVMRGDRIVAILGTGNKPTNYDEKDVSDVSLLADLAWEIAERKRAEIALLESETRYRRIVDTANEGIWLLGPDGITIAVNARMAQILGHDSDELVGRPFSELMFEDDMADYREKMENRRKGVSEHYERRFRRKNGEAVWTQISATPVFDKNQSYEGSFGMVTDITERKHAEEALRESEKKFRSFVESSSEGFTLVDEQGAIIEWNSAREKMTGLAASQVLGQKLWDVQYQLILPTLQTPEFYRRFKQTLLDALATGKSPIFDQTLEVEILQREHPPRYIRQTVFPIRTEKGFRIGSVTSDITERRRAEEEIHKLNQELELRVAQRTTQLEAANKELEAFAYSVSHDLRAPLRAIDGFSQILIEGTYESLDATARGYLDRVRGGAQRMAQLIDDLLNLSRVSRSEMVIQSVDLSQVARRVADELRGLDSHRDVTFEIQGGVTVAGDDRLLRIVLENLLGNAWKYTSKHQTARIEFGMLRQDEKPVCFVRDDGSGFDMQYREKLFGAFQRLHTTTDFPGTGIGLATVQRIVNRHGGKVWAVGEIEKGATFYFTIP
jgi:PAS domain S-box-containing protein